MSKIVRNRVRAPYMEWAKIRSRPPYDLAGSHLLPCSLDDLEGAREALELAGPNDEGYAPLIDAIAERYGVSADCVATAAGCSGANLLVCAALLGPGDEVLVERPAYDPLLAVARLVGAAVGRFERRREDGYALDPDRVAALITRRTRLIVVTNPHNPSGVVADPEALVAVGELADRAGARVLVDEVYLDTARGPTPPSAAVLGEGLISTGSLTKAYGLPGLRCGWVIAASEDAHAVRRARDVVDAIGAFPAEVLATVAFGQLDRLAARARDILEPNFERLRSFVDQRPELEWVEPGARCVAFPWLHEVDDAGPFVERLRDAYETAVAPGRFFEAPAHFRVGLGADPDTLARGLERVGRALDDDVHLRASDAAVAS